MCLGQCEEVFSLSILQDALKANTFSKWLHRIQIAEIEQASIEGLEQCPFCPLPPSWTHFLKKTNISFVEILIVVRIVVEYARKYHISPLGVKKYSALPNKRVGPNKRVESKFSQNSING